MKPFKILFRGLLFLGLLGGGLRLSADTYVFLRNYTPFPLTFKSAGQVLGEKLGSDKYMQYSVSGGVLGTKASATIIHPGESLVIAKFNRDIGIKKDEVFVLNQLFEIPGFNQLGQNNQPLSFEVRQKLVGTATGSDISLNLGQSFSTIQLTPAQQQVLNKVGTVGGLLGSKDEEIARLKVSNLQWSTGAVDYSLNRGKEKFLIHAQLVGSTRNLATTKKADAFDDIEVTVNWSLPYDMPKATGPDEINVGFQNLWMRPDWVALGCVKTRAPLVANLLAPSTNATQNTFDVLTFTEAFNDDAKNLFDLLRQRGYQYQTGVLGAEKITGEGVVSSAAGDISKTKILNGGVAIASKYPFVKKDSVLFSDCAQDDCQAWKGAWYAKIDKQGRAYHIFAVHTNASYDMPPTPDTVQARQKQLNQLKQFIEKQAIPKNEPVIIAGDMNIDLYNSTEYQDMLKRLNAVHPKLIGYQGQSEAERDGKFYTFNYKLNRLPNDANDYLNLQFLDYVLYANDYLKPLDSYNEMRMYTLDKPYTCSASDFSIQGLQRAFTKPGKRQTLDFVNTLSDHWFIYGYFKFPAKPSQ